MNRTEMIILGGAAVAALGVAYFVFGSRHDSGGFFQPVGEAVGGAVVDLAGGVLAGAVQGVGDIVGIPRTNKTECQLALEQGRTWDASFACPAGTFIKSFF